MLPINLIRSMRRSTLTNYIVPGLTSSLLTDGVVRLFEASREQHNDIVPHSHRFNFACFVMRGRVINRIWKLDGKGDTYQSSTLTYNGGPGKYGIARGECAGWGHQDSQYNEGQWYTMTADQIHSITFSPDAIVLFFEGPMISAVTTIIEPVVAGERVDTFKVEPWMFKPTGEL